MEAISPELLVKEDLIFEIKARGKEPAGDANGLRKQFREYQEVPMTDIWDSSWDSKQELAVCQRKFEDWEIEEFRTEPPSGREKLRVAARLSHLARRLKLLNTATDLEVSDRVWITESGQTVQEMLELLKRVAASASSTPQPVILAPMFPKKASTETVAEATPPPSSQEEVNVKKFDTGQSTRASSSVGVSYNKLPNPMGGLLQSIPVVDGLEVDALLSFLSSIFKLRDFPGITDQDMLRLLVPYCRSPLSDRLTSVLVSGENFDCFHKLVLECFVPVRLRDRLKLDHFYRPQGTRESLAAFVSSIKSFNRVLRLGLSESEVVDVIVDGINMSERSRLVFAGRPSSFLDLDRICITSNNVQFSDHQREMTEKQLNKGPGAVFMVGEGQGGFGRGRGPPVCFGCGQRGHIRRFCRQGSQASPKNGEGEELPREQVKQHPV